MRRAKPARPHPPDRQSAIWNRAPRPPLADLGRMTTENPMKSKSINDGVERTFVLILDQGEEAFKTITEFADREKITGASVSAIGAFAKATVGWFDLAAKKYKPIEV